MWLPQDEEQQGWELGGWCPAVPPGIWGTQLWIATWGEISLTGENLFYILWFSWGVSKPAIFPCRIGRMSVAGAHGASGRLCLGVTANLARVLESNQAQGGGGFGRMLTGTLGRCYFGLSRGARPYVV